MFGLFKKKTPAANESYIVYKSQNEKYRKLIHQIRDCLAQNQKVVIFYHTDSTKQDIIRLFEAASIAYTEESIVGEGQVALWQSGNIKGKPSSDRVLVAEMDMYRTKNRELAEALKGQKLLKIYTSLDHPLFEALGGDQLRRMMETMGINENESIEHSLVTKAIINAQEKLEKKR